MVGQAEVFVGALRDFNKRRYALTLPTLCVERPVYTLLGFALVIILVGTLLTFNLLSPLELNSIE